ncbi:hypothetical protein [Cryptosporangium sp. NPDC048952]|uniref:hypothetical protein n=1 Tax=Cryptosporangium sp. NPDC048952 TaxID=3363961 RepID=UPI0037218539
MTGSVLTRPWWTTLLVVDYLFGAHLLVVFGWAWLGPKSFGLAFFAVGGVPLIGLAILVGWAILGATWRNPGPRPAVDALVAAGVGALAAPILAVPLLVLWAWAS